MKWIKITEDLPQMGQRVLCIQDPKKTATKEPLFAIYSGQEFLPPAMVNVFANFEIGKSKWSHITHWMPLPQPPEN